MSPGPELQEREALILNAVVHSYITTAEPVGSRTIVKRFGLDLSPATVRNVMADLEDSGYLQQIHTSSGRVPTDAGYRYYVDYLMRVQHLTMSERAQIEHELTQRLNDADEVMKHTSELLALVTHHAGLVEAPDERGAEVRRVEVMPISGARAAVLIVDSYGRVRTVMVTLDTPLSSGEVARLNRFLNENVYGLHVGEMTAKMESMVNSLLDEQRQLAAQAVGVLTKIGANRPARLYLEGTVQLFEQPEFQDVARAREVFDLLGEGERLAALLRASVSAHEGAGPAVLIGLDGGPGGLKDISIIASPYRVGDEKVGVLGVIGPRRMPYSRFAAVVDYTATMVSKLLTKLAG